MGALIFLMIAGLLVAGFPGLIVGSVLGIGLLLGRR